MPKTVDGSTLAVNSLQQTENPVLQSKAPDNRRSENQLDAYEY
jgi:hypothetical protein